MKTYTVRAVRCDHRASEQQIYDALRRATDPLERAWERLARADRIVIKLNMMKLPDRIAWFEGRRRELVDDAVCRAVLRLLRERTSAPIAATDTNPYTPEHLMGADFNYARHLRDFGVSFVDSNLPPFKTYEVPGGGSIFARYTLSACLEGAEVVSVAKLKNHRFMGVTLTTKNLFGLPPISRPAGRARAYFHHFVRLPYVLADLARIADPCLGIVDALTGQWGMEWGGDGRVCDALIAGDQTIATDACAAWLMGHDPESDWPTPPFRRDRNHLLAASEAGYGTVRLEEIDFESEVRRPLGLFDSVVMDSHDLMASWLATACEQALAYEERRPAIVARHGGHFVYLQKGDVVWSGPDPEGLASRRELSGGDKEQAMWLKLADPEEREGERFEVYRKRLRWYREKRRPA
jgi:uncharacterized protein (DUF362 family)